MVKSNVIKSAFILTLCGIVCKVIGALYRVPLTALLGAEGIGMYYLIFPIFSFLLSLSSSASSSVLSKLVAECISRGETKKAKTYFGCSCKLFGGIGFVCVLVLIIFAPILSSIQNNQSGIYGYISIAPAILFVCLISCFRGYFQGYQNMTYSGISQIIEQIVKVGLGLVLAGFLAPLGLEFGVLGCITAITISEIVALIYLFITYLMFKRKENKEAIVEEIINKKECYKTLIKMAIPFTLSFIIFPLSLFLESIMIVPLLTRSGLGAQKAVSIFGLSNGVVSTLTNLPVVVSTSLAMVIIPSISFYIKQGKKEIVEEKITFIFKIATLIILPCVVVFAVFPQDIIFSLFGSLKSGELNEMMISSRMLIVSSLGVLYLAIFQISTAILQATGRYFVPVVSLSIGIIIKIIVSLILLNLPEINIYATSISSSLCFVVITMINMSYLQKDFNIKINYYSLLFIPCLALVGMGISIVICKSLFASFLPMWIAIIASFVVGGGVYIACLLVFGVFEKLELAAILKKASED